MAIKEIHFINAPPATYAIFCNPKQKTIEDFWIAPVYGFRCETVFIESVGLKTYISALGGDFTEGYGDDSSVCYVGGIYGCRLRLNQIKERYKGNELSKTV